MRKLNFNISTAVQADAKKSLPAEEWDFTSSSIDAPPLWQWNDWLNYEYARSCRPIVEAVLVLRKQNTIQREAGSWPAAPEFPRHAVYLAKTYPGFPQTPWLKLPESQRKLRGEIRDPIGGPFEEDTFQVLNAFDFADQIATGDLWLDSKNITDHKYSVFKIDFMRDKRLIERKFRRWLEHGQTEYLKKRQAAIDALRARVAVPPEFSNEVHTGQAKNKRRYVTAFKQLSALRLLEHHKYDYSRCVAETENGRGKPLYNGWNSNGWFEAAREATARLVRFNIMWTLEAEPAYFFKFGEFHEVLKWHHKLKADLKPIKSMESSKKILEKLFCSHWDRKQLGGIR